jgi:hypothetical protein
VAVVGLTAQDVASHVSIVQTLHDDDNRRLLVVEAVRHRFADEPDRLIAFQVALGLDDVVRIVEQDAVAALTGGDATTRGRKLEPGHVVFKPALAGLGEGEPVTPQLPVGWAMDEPYHLVVVAGGNLVAVAERDVAHVGQVARAPFPGWPKHINQQGLLPPVIAGIVRYALN